MSSFNSANASRSNLGNKTAIFIQNACLQHRYIRSKDTSNIVERAERLRAVNIGLSSAIARLGELYTSNDTDKADDPNDLAAEMNKLRLEPSTTSTSTAPVDIIQSHSSSDLLSDAAVKFIHGDIDGDDYLENLTKWIKESHNKIAEGGSEIPESLSQGDLYLCPGSLNALRGAVGTVCEAVDKVVSRNGNPLRRAFVAIRPPGHHCGEDTPSGFCFLNNISIAAAHAHLKHNINRIVIFDIDLHHGNGTQSIVWQINEESYRQTLEMEAGAQINKPGPKVYYGSTHDILSYPCEDGKVSLVQAASVSLHKVHGQYIQNVHLQTYTSEEHFWDVLYKDEYSKILDKARAFLDDTGGPGDDVLFFISCGMDACEHEYESMSRHNRKVPASFYHRFTRDACLLSDQYADGRLISVLEGGYSDRALISGAMAHLCGLVDLPEGLVVDEDWWGKTNLSKLEAATKKRRGGRPSLPAAGSVEPWLERTLAIFGTLDSEAMKSTGSAPRSATPVPPSDRTLRDRSKAKGGTPSAPPKSSLPSVSIRLPPSMDNEHHLSTYGSMTDGYNSTDSSLSTVSSTTSEETTTKKLPRVILHLGKPPTDSSEGVS